MIKKKINKEILCLLYGEYLITLAPKVILADLSALLYRFIGFNKAFIMKVKTKLNYFSNYELY
ncbi:MAG: hypothetical protein KatS3mg068_0207 [Candidatus Sericytochromatia bacterium]|nr:MAG: hypothetical protein KatS3mg068_0207 [Candidatus Sericytochromatia bacterium]